MNPSGLMDCMSKRKLPLEDKENEIGVAFMDIRKIFEKLKTIETIKLSEEAKTEIHDSLKKEIELLKDDMYCIVESIVLPKFEPTKEE